MEPLMLHCGNLEDAEGQRFPTRMEADARELSRIRIKRFYAISLG